MLIMQLFDEMIKEWFSKRKLKCSEIKRQKLKEDQLSKNYKYPLNWTQFKNIILF